MEVPLLCIPDPPMRVSKHFQTMMKLERGDEIVTFPPIVYSESDLGCQYLSISFHKHQLQGFMEWMPTFFYFFKAIQKVKNIYMLSYILTQKLKILIC